MKNLLGVFLIFTAFFLAGTPAEKNVSPAAADARIIKKAESVTKDRFPDADNVLLYEKERSSYNTNGTYRSTDEFYVKVLTEKGRSGLRQLSFHFNDHYNRVNIEAASIFKPNGQIVPVDIKSNTHAVIDSSQMASNIYDPAQKRLVLSLPHIEVGDVLYLRAADEHFKARIPDFWSNYTLLQSTWPIIESVVEIDAPAELPLRSIALKDEVKGSVKFSKKQKGSRILYTWRAADVPQVISEPGMPEIHTCVQRLLVSTARSWEEVSRWYWNLCSPRLKAVTPAMKEQVQKLLKDKKNDLEKVKAVFQFVSQQIRYMGITPEKEAPGYEPHDVRLTFEQRYGVCRDKAALLVAMLQLAGFKAYPVLFMAGDPKDPEIPNGYFNHAVTAVELEKDNFILMDPTYESTSELFPAFQADMSYLVAHPVGKKLRRSPIIPAKKNLAKIRTSGEIDAGNKLHCESIIELFGVNDVYYRGALSRWPDEQKEQFFLGRLRRVIPGARLEKLEVTPRNIRDMSTPLKFKIAYSAALEVKDGQCQLLMPELSSVFGIGEAVFQDLELLKRKYPLRFMTTCSTDEAYSVKLPAALKIMALPEKDEFRVGGKIAYSGETLLQKDVIKAKRKLEVNTLEIKAAEYPALKVFLNKLKNARTFLPVAENHFGAQAMAVPLKTFPGADSVIESREVEVKVRSIDNWSVRNKSRRRILNYAGVKAHSEIKIPYLAGWNEVEHVKARVIAPDGKVKEVSPAEINHMDSPRNSAGPRYPAEKIMVISLPGVAPRYVVELDVKYRKINRPVFSEKFLFASSSAPVIRSELTLDFPADLYISGQVAGKNRVSFSEYTTEGRRVKKWQISSLARIKNEAGQPPWPFFLPGVILNSGNANRVYAAKVNAALLEKSALAPETAAALVKKEKWDTIKDTAEKVLKVRDYVDKFIRKVPLPLNEIPLTALSSPRVTLESGYGNSADRAILTGALLKALNVDFSFVGVSAVGYTARSSKFFLHNADPLGLSEKIAVYIPSLQWYLNDTGRFAPPGSVVSEGAVCMDLKSGRIMPFLSAARNNSGRVLKFHIKCESDTAVRIQVTEELYGKEYEAVRKEFETATPEMRRRFFEARVSSLGHGGQLDGTPAFDFSRYPGVLRYKVKNDGFLARSGEYRILPLPGYSLLHRTLALPAVMKRQTPLWRNAPRTLALSWGVMPPPGWEVVSFRPEKTEAGKYGSYSFSEHFSRGSGQIFLHNKLTLPVEMVEIPDVVELEDWGRQAALPGRKTIMLKRISEEQKVK